MTYTPILPPPEPVREPFSATCCSAAEEIVTREDGRDYCRICGKKLSKHPGRQISHVWNDQRKIRLQIKQFNRSIQK